MQHQNVLPLSLVSNLCHGRCKFSAVPFKILLHSQQITHTFAPARLSPLSALLFVAFPACRTLLPSTAPIMCHRTTMQTPYTSRVNTRCMGRHALDAMPRIVDDVAVIQSHRLLIVVAHLQRRGSLAVTLVAGELLFGIGQHEWLPVHGVFGLWHPPLSSLRKRNNVIDMWDYSSVCTSGGADLGQIVNDIRCALLYEDRRALRFAVMPDVSKDRCTIGPKRKCTFWDVGAAQVVKHRVGLAWQGDLKKTCSARQDQLHEMAGWR